MNVEIPPEFQPFVHQVIDGGSYKDEVEVVGEALRLLKAKEQQIEELRREVRPALDELDRGEGIELRDESELRRYFDDVKRRGRDRRERERPSQ